MKSKRVKEKGELNWYEENPYVLGFKVILIASALVFIVEPLFYDKIVKADTYTFMNKGVLSSLVFLISISIAFYLFGHIHSKIKKARISLLDSLLILIGLYGVFLGFIKVDQYPTQWFLPSYILAALIAWIAGSVLDKRILKGIKEALIYNVNFLRQNEVTINEEGIEEPGTPIILDLSIKELVTKTKTVEDLDKEGLNFLPLAKNILAAIKNFPSNKSITIGINGDWGSGKSSLIDLIDYQLEKRSEVKTIEFKPWLYPDESSLLHSFFKIWKNEINNLSVQLAFEDYAQYLTGIQYASSKWDIFNLFKSKDSLSNTKKIITEYLNTHGEKYIIIVDDLDRLEANEIIEVAKLTRAIADFPNTIYILAYDRVYIDALLKKKFNNSKGANFFDKIVSVEYQLPKLDSKLIKRQLFLLLEKNKEFIKKYDSEFTNESIETKLNILEEDFPYHLYLPTLRDIKRFLNGVLLRFSSISQTNNVKFLEIFILEIFFYKNRKSYDKIYQRKNEFISYLIGKDPNENIINELNINPNSLLEKNVKGLPSYTIKNTLDIYYSYLDSREFNINDIDQVFDKSNSSDYVRKFVKDGFAQALLIGTIRKLLDMSISTRLIDLEKSGKYDIIKNIEHELINSSDKLNDDQLYNLTEAIIDAYLKLDIAKQRRNEADRQSIDRLRAILFHFRYKFPVYKNRIDGNNILLESVKYSFVEKRIDDDDSSFNKIFNLNGYRYNFTFDVPDISHWRIGFKFSENEEFPINTPIRFVTGYPLFHIGKNTDRDGFLDQNNIKATYYKNTDASANEVKDDTIYGVAFLPEKKLRLRLSQTTGGISVTIFNNQNLYRTIDLPDTSRFKFAKLYAWTDNKAVNLGASYKFLINLDVEINQGGLI